MIEDSFEFKVRPGSPFSLSARSPSVGLGGRVSLPLSYCLYRHLEGNTAVKYTALLFILVYCVSGRGPKKIYLLTSIYFQKKQKMSAL